MKIEVITTGNEIMSGLTLDTNFSWLADRLFQLGFMVSYHTSVGDDPESIVDAIRCASRRSGAVVVSGGLGATEDDLTAECAARAFGLPLELNEGALRMIEEAFRTRGRELREINKKPAMMPRGSVPLWNEYGTAPGFMCEYGGVVFFFLPGVPGEFRQMVMAHVLSELDSRAPDRAMTYGVIIKTTGVRESEVAELLSGLSIEGVSLGYRAHFPEVHLRVTASGRTREEARALVDRFTEEVRRRLGDCVFSTGGETLEEVVARLLMERGVTLSVAESCTGGLLANRITNVPGSSGFFERGVVTYSNESKTELLGVPSGLFKTVGAVSAEVVEHMAMGVRELARTDIGVGISGIAGPGGGTPEKPVGTVYIGFSHRSFGARSKRYQLTGTREQIKLAASQAALDLIRKFFLNDV